MTKQMKTADVPTEIHRSFSVQVGIADEFYAPTVEAIRKYRAICRQCYSILLLAETAAAEISEVGDAIRLTPNSERSKALLSELFEKRGKALAYELREHVREDLWPDSLSFVFDSIRRDVVNVWKSKDPEFPKAGRGWLALQGARDVARFNRRGIGFPRATAHPKLHEHAITLKWDHKLGEIDLNLPRLDWGRYYPWKCLRDQSPDWQLGTLFLTERDRKVKVVISYTRPTDTAPVDRERVCVVRFPQDENESLIRIAGPDGVSTYDSIDREEALAWLRQMRTRRVVLEKRRAACGNPRAPWGHRKAWVSSQDTLSRLTLKRSRGEADRNHAWTRRILSRAVSWRCGVIQVENLPEKISEYEWSFGQFMADLRYKADEQGVSVSTLTT